MNLSSLVHAFSTGSYTVTRIADGTFSGGVYASGAISAFVVEASVRPATSRMIAVLPEGARSTDVLVMYTGTELMTQGSSAPDEVDINGEQYVASHVKKWSHDGTVTYEVLLTKRSVP